MYIYTQTDHQPPVLEVGEKGVGTLLHWQIMTFEIFTWKNKTWKYCLYNNNLLFFY